jgi:hypothetical protein
MRKSLSIFLAGFLLSLTFMAAPALAQQVTIENNTSANLSELYVSNVDTNSWEDNVLGGRVLKPGDKFEHNFNGKYTMYDLKAVFDNGREQPYYGINVKQFRYIRLNPDGVESFK